MRRRHVTHGLRALCCATAAMAMTACGEGDTVVGPRADWLLVWNDEFDGADGEEVDQGRWTYDIGTGENGWGNGEQQFYTDRTQNIATDGEGRLAITAVEEDFGGSRYTSARIKTEGLFAQEYGRIEARIQLPQGDGVWPAFWMLGADFAEVGWPQTGEIDIMEFRGQHVDEIHGSLHGPGYSAGEAITNKLRVPDGNFVDDFHVYAVEWEPTRIAWFVDDEVYAVVTETQVLGEGEWVFDHPFFLILNVAVSGSFVFNLTPDNLPQSMLVDYVRVFSRDAP